MPDERELRIKTDGSPARGWSDFTPKDKAIVVACAAGALASPILLTLPLLWVLDVLAGRAFDFAAYWRTWGILGLAFVDPILLIVAFFGLDTWLERTRGQGILGWCRSERGVRLIGTAIVSVLALLAAFALLRGLLHF